MVAVRRCGRSLWWSSVLSSHIAGCRCPGGREANLGRCAGSSQLFSSGLSGWERCSSRPRRWCSQSRYSPQYNCLRILELRPEEEETLEGLAHYWLCVSSPGEVLGEVYAAAADPLYWSPVDGDGGGGCSLVRLLKSTISSLVLLMLLLWHQLFRVCTFSLQADSSSSVIRPTTVVSSANLTMTLELCVTTQSCVYREYRRGLRTQPWGAPVLWVSGKEMLLPTLITCLLGSPGSSCTENCSDLEHYRLRGHYGITHWAVVNTITYVFLLSRWERAVCRVKAIAS